MYRLSPLVYVCVGFWYFQRGRLVYNTDEMDGLAVAYEQLYVLGRLQSTYTSLCGANLFLLILRIVNLLTFQARMGILTRTTSRAMEDLQNVSLLLAMVMVVYTLIRHVIVGPKIHTFYIVESSMQVSEVGFACSVSLSVYQTYA